MIKKLLSVFAFSFAFAAMAQVSFGGFPYNWEDKHVSSQILFNTMPAIDMEALAAEDAVVAVRPQLLQMSDAAAATVQVGGWRVTQVCDV